MATILQVLPKFDTGGTEYETLDTVNFLIKSGHKCIVLSSGGALIEKLDPAVINIADKYIKSKNPFFLFRNVSLIRNIIKKYNVDLIHARSRAQAWCCFYALKNFPKIKYITSFHGLYGMQNYFKKFYNSSMVRSNKIIAVSNFCKEYILQYYPNVASKVITVHSWVDDEKTNIDQHYIDHIKHELHIDKHTKIIFLPGRLSPTKGHEFWIKAMAKVHEYDVICLSMAGTEPLRDYLAKITEKLNFRHRLEFIQYTDKISSLYHMADIVVCPSTKSESFGKTAVEACLMEKPVIANDLGAFKETIIDGKTGWLVKNGDIDGFAKKIEEVLLMDNTEKSKITAAARKYVLDNFSAKEMLPKLVKIYEDLLK